MPLDVSGYIVPQQNYGGLYTAAQTLEQRRQREIQLGLQQQRLQQTELARKQAAATFLNNYVDKEHQLTGTTADQYINPMLQEAMNQGTALAAKGVDTPTIMMTLNPLIQRISDYSMKAKAVSKQVDDTIAKMKENKYEGYDYAKLRDEAMHNAFFDTDESGNPVLNPGKADPSTNWALKTIQDSPEKVTTSAGFDQYAKDAKQNSTLADNNYYDKIGTLNRRKVELVAPDYLIPERDERGTITGFVPKHDTATENGQPLYHDFTDASGQQQKAPVRLLDEGIFDTLPPGLIDNIRGQVKQHLKEYEDKTGEPIPENSVKAKLVARALAYNEFNIATRKGASIKNADVYNKPSAFDIRYNMGDDPRYLNEVQLQAAARAAGRGGNPFQAVSNIFMGEPGSTGGAVENVNGKKMINVTDAFPKGGLRKGLGDEDKYTSIYWDPRARQLIVNEEKKNDVTGMVEKHPETISESGVPAFLWKIAQANGMDVHSVKPFLTSVGYNFKTGKFASGDAGSVDRIKDFEDKELQEKTDKLHRDADDFKSTKDLNFLKDWKGTQTSEGQIDKISKTSWNWNSDYFIKFKDGKEHYFKDATELSNYLKQPVEKKKEEQPAAQEQPAQATKGAKEETPDERYKRLQAKNAKNLNK